MTLELALSAINPDTMFEAFFFEFEENYVKICGCRILILVAGVIS
jgi:hypothetical protein